MKATLYIEKSDFDSFFVWINRTGQGIISTCPVVYSHTSENFTSPVQLLLDASEYTVVCKVEKELQLLREKLGGIIEYEPNPVETDRILMAAILKNAECHDMTLEVINTALEIALTVSDITPIEALIISERECLNVGKNVTEI